MTPPTNEPCFEVLFVTILLWVALFGIVDVLVAQIESIEGRLAAYTAVGAFAVFFVAFARDVTFCSLQ